MQAQAAEYSGYAGPFRCCALRKSSNFRADAYYALRSAARSDQWLMEYTRLACKSSEAEALESGK
jgi:hypothetical protein